jgi:hypothetical protein
MRKPPLVLSLFFAVPLAWAQDPGADAPAPLPLPPKVESGKVLEPDVTIIERPNEQIQQYSVNGRVYMVRITPSSGPPYYLLDLDGDGELDVKSNNPGDNWVPQWVLFSW